jgi:hypothetical protein
MLIEHFQPALFPSETRQIKFSAEIIFFNTLILNKLCFHLFTGLRVAIADIVTETVKRLEDSTVAQTNESIRTQSELHLYLNPGSHAVTLFFGVPAGFHEKKATIEIHDVYERPIWRSEEHIVPGLNKIVWNGTDNNGQAVINGKYIVKVSMENNSLEQAFLFVR